MKEVVGLFVAMVAAVSLSACGGQAAIEGNVGEVVDQCQSVKAGATPTVEVTGYVIDGMVTQGERDDGTLYAGAWLCDSSDFEDEAVCINFGQTDQETIDQINESNRVTVRGTVYGIESDLVFLEDCELVSAE